MGAAEIKLGVLHAAVWWNDVLLCDNRFRTRRGIKHDGVLKKLKALNLLLKYFAQMRSLSYLRPVKECCDLSRTLKNATNKPFKYHYY